MATKGLGRGLESLLVDVPAEMGLASNTADETRYLYQTQQQLLHEAIQLRELLMMFEEMLLLFNDTSSMQDENKQSL
jgi:hypothetical protein